MRAVGCSRKSAFCEYRRRCFQCVVHLNMIYLFLYNTILELQYLRVLQDLRT